MRNLLFLSLILFSQASMAIGPNIKDCSSEIKESLNAHVEFADFQIEEMKISRIVDASSPFANLYLKSENAYYIFVTEPLIIGVGVTVKSNCDIERVDFLH